MARRIRSRSKIKPKRTPADRRLWSNIRDAKVETYDAYLKSKTPTDPTALNPVALFARDFAKAAIPVFLIFNVPRVLKWAFRGRGPKKPKVDPLQQQREEMLKQQQAAMRQQLLQQQMAAARQQAAAAAKPATAAPAAKPAPPAAAAAAEQQRTKDAAARAVEDRVRLVERLRQLKQAKLEAENKKAAAAAAAGPAAGAAPAPTASAGPAPPRGLGAALQKPRTVAAAGSAAAAATAAPKGLGSALGAPKGLGAGLGGGGLPPAPKGLGAGLGAGGLPPPKGLGAGLGGAGLGAPKGLGGGLLPRPKLPANGAAEEKPQADAAAAEKPTPKGLGGLSLPSKPKGMGAGLGLGSALPPRPAPPADPAAPPATAPQEPAAPAPPSGLGSALPPRNRAAAPGLPQLAGALVLGAAAEQQEAAEAMVDAAPATPQQQEAPPSSSGAALPRSRMAAGQEQDGWASDESAESAESAGEVVAPTTPTPEAMAAPRPTAPVTTPGSEADGQLPDVADVATPEAGAHARAAGPEATSRAKDGTEVAASGDGQKVAGAASAVVGTAKGAGESEAGTAEARGGEEAVVEEKWEFRGATPEAVTLPDGSGVVVVRRMAGNNSCLFNAVDYLKYGQRASGGGSKHEADSGGMQLRMVVANEVEDHPDRYSDAFLEMPNDRYVDWIMRPSSWGGGIELAILASHFSVELAAWNIDTAKCHTFGEESGYKEQGMLIYDGQHYDALAVTPFQGADPIQDVTLFDPSSRRFRMVAAAAQKLVELHTRRKKGIAYVP